jgi:hypothetical protein
MDDEYKSLQTYAKVSFWFWFLSSAMSFILLVIGIALLFRAQVLPGSITLASEVLVFGFQRVFKDRENYYRREMKQKTEFLELGNLWNMSVQSLEGITDPDRRIEKLSQVIDKLMERFPAQNKS